MTAPKNTKRKVKFLHNESTDSLARAMNGRVSFNSFVGLTGRSINDYYRGFTFHGFSPDVDYVLYYNLEPFAWHTNSTGAWAYDPWNIWDDSSPTLERIREALKLLA